MKFDTIDELAAEYPKLREAHEAAMTICAADALWIGGHRQARAGVVVAYGEELRRTSSDVEGGAPEEIWTSGFPGMDWIREIGTLKAQESKCGLYSV